MLRRISLVIVAALSLAAVQVLAHEGHDHEDEALSEKRVAQLAARTLPALVKAKKVGAAWSSAQREGITTRDAAGKEIWVVAYKNPDGKVDGGQLLYLLFDDLGNFIESNHSGKLQTE
jgi:hypothetical protein